MHKDLNAVKGGNEAMMRMWKENGWTGPVALPNRDNAVALRSVAATASKAHAEKATEAGAVKLTSLAGAIFNHKDDKKGQQDTARNFFELHLGYALNFPDTSNTRFQSHCRASEVITVHKDLFVTLLEQVGDRKDKMGLNHMEKNVLKGLQDVPTLTEVSVLALYSQAISRPYMRQVRGPGLVNALDLVPLHLQVKKHCQDIIDNPDLLLSPLSSHELGSLDGQVWQDPDVVNAVHRQAATMPHLRPALVAFFTGALNKWESFTSEFAAEGMLDRTSKALTERLRIWIHATNDINEGALGQFRVGMRHCPAIGLRKFNARTMYKMNGTRAYVDDLDPLDRKYLRVVARDADSGGLEKKRRRMHAEADQEAVRVKRVKRDEKLKKKAVKQKTMDDLQPRFDPVAIFNFPGTVAQIDLELAWHRQYDPLVPSGKATLPNKAAKLAALLEAVQRYNQRKAIADAGGIVDQGDMEGGGGTEDEYDERMSDVDSDDEHVWG
ncbi:hypothetical protein BXZ70DRAFT_1009820 [Cristinia sonorae]|uniref:Uncharacterized protein n=1 Tax=Cristinia sonorae TaxID=1940300 RepID=A0A8K0XN59_9AGAR|nr:hypothetical protein BXZ70DRAFT_1009820 [Cristinia sonorae]